MRLRYFIEVDINDRAIEVERNRTMTEDQRLLPPAVLAEAHRLVEEVDLGESHFATCADAGRYRRSR